MVLRIFRKILRSALLLAMMGCQLIPNSLSGQVTYRRLPLKEYRSKMMAGWLGQMVGVSFGAPTELSASARSCRRVRCRKFKPGWRTALCGQDDLYVEMTFLRTLEEYGLDATADQAGLDFARSEYPLWHANGAGRINLRSGIAPPDSRSPGL